MLCVSITVHFHGRGHESTGLLLTLEWVLTAGRRWWRAVICPCGTHGGHPRALLLGQAAPCWRKYSVPERFHCVCTNQHVWGHILSALHTVPLHFSHQVGNVGHWGVVCDCSSLMTRELSTFCVFGPLDILFVKCLCKTFAHFSIRSSLFSS